MQSAMKQSFGSEWTSVLRVRSRDGQQAYMYLREDGKNINLTVVTIDRQQAAVVRAIVSPERLADFVNDPKIFGISLSDGKDDEPKQIADTPKENK